MRRKMSKHSSERSFGAQSGSFLPASPSAATTGVRFPDFVEEGHVEYVDVPESVVPQASQTCCDSMIILFYLFFFQFKELHSSSKCFLPFDIKYNFMVDWKAFRANWAFKLQDQQC